MWSSKILRKRAGKRIARTLFVEIVYFCCDERWVRSSSNNNYGNSNKNSIRTEAMESVRGKHSEKERWLRWCISPRAREWNMYATYIYTYIFCLFSNMIEVVCCARSKEVIYLFECSYIDEYIWAHCWWLIPFAQVNDQKSKSRKLKKCNA